MDQLAREPPRAGADGVGRAGVATVPDANSSQFRSRLEQILRAGGFAVTAELSPPDSADPEVLYRRAEPLFGVVDAVNVPDAPSAHVHLCAMAAGALLVQRGYEVVMQMACRDRNRIALQGDLLGAQSLGIRNLLCLTGDDVSGGDHPEAKRVFDLDSLQLLRAARALCEDGVFLSGRKADAAPGFFLGAASNPFVPPYDWRPLRLAKKVEAGARFVQTQFCFDIGRLRGFMERARDLGLHEKAFLLIGVGPLASERAAEYMRSRVPGVVIPDDVVGRLRRAPAHKKREEGQRVCLEMIEQIRRIEGVSGIHVIAYRKEEWVAEIIEEAQIAPRCREKGSKNLTVTPGGESHA